MEIAKFGPWVSGQVRRVSLNKRASNAADAGGVVAVDVGDEEDEEDEYAADEDDYAAEDEYDGGVSEKRLRLAELMAVASNIVGFVASCQACASPRAEVGECLRAVKVVSV